MPHKIADSQHADGFCVKISCEHGYQPALRSTCLWYKPWGRAKLAACLFDVVAR